MEQTPEIQALQEEERKAARVAAHLQHSQPVTATIPPVEEPPSDELVGD